MKRYLIELLEVIKMNDLLLIPLTTGSLIAISFALIGSIIVLKRMSFIGAGLSHSSFAGVSISLLLNAPILILTFLYNLVSSIIILKLRGEKNEDSLIGVIFSFSMALAIIILYAGNITTSITQILFGDILTVNKDDLVIAVITLLLVASVFYKKGKEMVYFSFDEEYLKVKGKNTDRIYFILLLLVSYLITIGIKMIGVLLVSSFLVIPPLSSSFISKNIKELFIYSSIFSVISLVFGLYSSLYLDVPASGLIVIASSLIFIITYFLGRGKG